MYARTRTLEWAWISCKWHCGLLSLAWHRSSLQPLRVSSRHPKHRARYRWASVNNTALSPANALPFLGRRKSPRVYRQLTITALPSNYRIGPREWCSRTPALGQHPQMAEFPPTGHRGRLGPIFANGVSQLRLSATVDSMMLIGHTSTTALMISGSAFALSVD